MLLLTALGNLPLMGSFERLPQPAAVSGRGLAGCALADASFSLLNPAALASITSAHLMLFHSPSPFGLPELSNGGLAFSVPMFSGALQASATTTGGTIYREQSVMLAYALPLDDAVSFGAALSYNALSIERYGSAHTIGIDIGIAVEPIHDMRLGASVLNVNRPTIGIARDELPRIFMLGAAVRLSDQADISADIIKDIRYPESVRIGIEVRPLQYVALRTGVSGAPSRFYAGIGVRVSFIEFDYSITTHQELGPTHTIGLDIEL